MQAEKLIQGLVPGRKVRKEFPKVAIIDQVPAKASRRRNIPAGRMKDTSRSRKTNEQKKMSMLRKRKTLRTTLLQSLMPCRCFNLASNSTGKLRLLFLKNLKTLLKLQSKVKRKEKKEKEKKAKDDKKEREKLMELFEDEKKLLEMFESPKKSKSKSKEPPKEKERRSETEKDEDVDESKVKFKLKDSKKLRSLTPEQE